MFQPRGVSSEYASDPASKPIDDFSSQGIGCEGKRSTTDPAYTNNIHQGGQRLPTSNAQASQRSSSQDYLDKRKLDHVIPQFYDIVRSKPTLKTLFTNHFESLDGLKQLIRQNQLNSVACKLMKMVIEQNTMHENPGSLLLPQKT